MSNDKQVCERTENAVKAYVADILAVATSFDDYVGDIDVSYDPCFDTDNTRQANSATIASELGVVIVFPDFKRKNAKAAVLNLGVINAMQKEGFDEEYIENEGKIYGKLLNKSTESAKLFGYYLTHKLNAKSEIPDVEDSED